MSSNHGGDLELAKAFIWAYAEAGADWVKFQSYQVKTLRPGDPQREWLAQAELSDEAHYILKAECEKAQTQFLTTVFHASRVPFLRDELTLDTLKVGSGEADVAMLTATTGFPRVILSGGLRFVRSTPQREWLRCVARYPAPPWMCHQHHYSPHDYWNVVGWSDHCVGLDICQQAIWHGARVIEKHVSLPEQKRPKRSFEATVDEFKELRAFADADPQQYVGRWQHQP